MTRVVYFTAGSVGAGHLVRGVALRRALSRMGWHGEYHFVGPPIAFPCVTVTGHVTVPIEQDLCLRRQETAPQSRLSQVLRLLDPDLVIVDLFWAPLRWVLPDMSAEAWLLLRKCPRSWLRGPVDARFDASQFSRVITIEPFDAEVLSDDVSFEHVPPVVVANPDERRPTGALRRRFGYGSDDYLSVVLQAGLRGEGASIAEQACSAPHRLVLDMFSASSLFPAAEWLGDANEIHTGAGYNAFWEAQWMGYARRTHFYPFARRLDDQAARATLREARMTSNGADVLARQIV